MYLVNFRPEAVLEVLLDGCQGFLAGHEVQVRHHSHHFREAVRLEQIEKLERFHFEPVASVHHQEHQVCSLYQGAQRK